MIQNVENVVKWLEVNNLEYWKVTLKDADNSNVFESDEAAFAANIKRFRDVMELCTGSRFYVKASEKKGINRGNFYEEFRNMPETPGLPQVNGLPQVQGVPVDEVERRISAAIEGLKKEQRMEALEAENKELKQDIKDMQTPINRMITKVEPYIGTILSSVISKFIPQAPQIQLAGIERTDEPETELADDENVPSKEHDQGQTKDFHSNEIEIRLMAALEKWSTADPDFLSLIEAVAEMAHTKDPMYDMAKNMLKK
jgi:hypothetical protein